MAKISEYLQATALSDDDLVVVSKNGNTNKARIIDMFDYHRAKAVEGFKPVLYAGVTSSDIDNLFIKKDENGVVSLTGILRDLDLVADGALFMDIPIGYEPIFYGLSSRQYFLGNTNSGNYAYIAINKGSNSFSVHCDTTASWMMINAIWNTRA